MFDAGVAVPVPQGGRLRGDVADGPIRGAQSAYPFNRGYIYR